MGAGGDPRGHVRDARWRPSRDYSRGVPNILVVADEAWVIDDVRAALSDAAYIVTVVSNPRDAVDQAAEIAADAVLVDFQVGSKGGMAVTRSLRGGADVGGTDHVPTILLLDREADAFLAGRSGADGWLRKPFGSFELRDLIDDVIGARAPKSKATR